MVFVTVCLCCCFNVLRKNECFPRSLSTLRFEVALRSRFTYFAAIKLVLLMLCDSIVFYKLVSIVFCMKGVI